MLLSFFLVSSSAPSSAQSRTPSFFFFDACCFRRLHVVSLSMTSIQSIRTLTVGAACFVQAKDKENARLEKSCDLVFIALLAINLRPSTQPISTKNKVHNGLRRKHQRNHCHYASRYRDQHPNAAKCFGIFGEGSHGIK